MVASSSSNNNNNHSNSSSSFVFIGPNFATNATLWLLIWTANNVGVTLLNKAAFSTVKFNYPFFLSAIHMAVCMAGAHVIFYSLERSQIKRQQQQHQNNNITSSELHLNIIEQILGTGIHRAPLDKTGQRLILIFSFLFSLNIAIGNVSLKYVSVNFNQVMRSLVPAITIGMGVCLGKPASKRRIIAVIPIVIGVALACFGDMSYTAIGFITTVACIVLAALKVVASGELLTGKVSLHPVDLLAHMAPLALGQCFILAILTGEVYQMQQRWKSDFPFGIFYNPQSYYPTFVVIMSGLLSFTLNISSLQANKLTSPLTLCIAANVKQVVMIAVSTAVFGTEISPLNGLGIIVVLAGSARYSYISLIEKEQSKNTILTNGSSSNSSNATTTNTTKSISSPSSGTLNNNTGKDYEMQSLLSDHDHTTTNTTTNTTTATDNSSNNSRTVVRRNHSSSTTNNNKDENELKVPLVSTSQLSSRHHHTLTSVDKV